MMQLALVLFVLHRFRSPGLAGVTIFLAIAPGILVSPVSGALLDRHGRVRFIILDYAVGALSLFLIVSLDVAGRIAPVAGAIATMNKEEKAVVGINLRLVDVARAKLILTDDLIDAARRITPTTNPPQSADRSQNH